MKLECIGTSYIEEGIFKDKTLNMPVTIGKIYEVCYYPPSHAYSSSVMIYTDKNEWQRFPGNAIDSFIPLD